ncbi:MAG: ammonium transporter [Acidimicrobiales bacterium]
MTEHADALWLTVAAVFVLFVNVGVFVVSQGFTRRRTVSTLVAHHVVHAGTALIGVAALGYGVAFGEGNSWFGSEWFGLGDLDLSARVGPGDDGPTHGARVLWHMAAAVTLSTATLTAIAERARLLTHAAAGFAIGAVVMPMAVRAARPEGLLADIGIGDTVFVDAGGSAVLYSVTGWMAVVGAMLIGPRLGRFGATGQPRVIPGRSMPGAVAGGLLVLAGWIGLAGGYLGEWSDDVPSAGVRLLLAGAGGGLGSAYASWVRTGQAGAAGAVRGLLAGLVAASAGMLVLSPTWAAVVGFFGGALVPLGTAAIERAKLDDPFGSVIVFAGGGVWGTLAVGLFATDTGLLDSANPDQLVAQLTGVLILASWAIVAGAGVFGLLKAVGRFRLDDDEELVGLEIVEQRASGAEDRAGLTEDDADT